MDAALLRERDLFKKRALTTPSVSVGKKRTATSKSDNGRRPKKLKSTTTSRSTPPITLDINTYRRATGSSQYKFLVLTKIVTHMRKRHQDGETDYLSLEEILDETKQLDVANKIKEWLSTEALVNNPKLKVSPEGKFLFKTLFKLKDRKSLLRLLKKHDLKGLGGILLEDVQESLPKCDKVLKNLENQNEIIFVTRQDKKKLLFYNDRSANLPVDEDFQKLWRSVAVVSMDEETIENYLHKQGISSIRNNGLKKVFRKKKAAPRKKVFKKPRDNEHVADVLENYGNNM